MSGGNEGFWGRGARGRGFLNRRGEGAAAPATRSRSRPPFHALAAAIVTMTNLLVGVLLFTATLPIGTRTLASGK